MPSDPDFIHRVVGYYEYDNALKHLDALVHQCTTEELEAINDLISMYDEYAVYVNLSRRASLDNSQLVEHPIDNQDRFERRGLNWVMALARVELAAMLSQYTAHPEPFLAYPPTEFDIAAYVELVEDGTRLHYGSLLRDETFAELAERTPDAVTLAYSRRLLLALRFANAMSGFSEADMTPPQQLEFTRWKGDLATWNLALVDHVRAYIRQVQLTSSTGQSSESVLQGFGATCSDLCDQLTNELQAMQGQPIVRD